MDLYTISFNGGFSWIPGVFTYYFNGDFHMAMLNWDSNQVMSGEAVASESS